MSVTFEVQKKVFAAVTAAVAGHASAPAVHAPAPEHAPTPPVAWSRPFAEVLEIRGLIYPPLDGAALTIPDAALVRCDCAGRDTARDQDGRTYTGSMIFAIYYEH